LFRVSSAVLSSQPLPVPEPDGSAKTYPDKLHAIVDHISQLTLLETAQLNELLKSKLNIPDAPVMPVGFAGAPPTQESQGSAEAVEEKTEFTVKLVKYSEDSKIKLIKEVKTLVEGMNLVQVGACMCVWVGACGVVIVWTPERGGKFAWYFDRWTTQTEKNREAHNTDRHTDRQNRHTDRQD
jgi:ribosomal protein L7/L12